MKQQSKDAPGPSGALELPDCFIRMNDGKCVYTGKQCEVTERCLEIHESVMRSRSTVKRVERPLFGKLNSWTQP